MTDDDVLLVEVADRVATVTLNRPRSRNALNRDLRRALNEGLRTLDTDDAVDVVILTGSDPAFCAGLDLKELGSSPTAGQEALPVDTPRRPADRGPFPAMSKPVIGAVNGPAITGGFEVALRCDLLVASERASFADTHARVGIMPDWGLTVLLPQAVGVRRAREMSLTGNFLDAATALAWGLVNHVVPHDDLLPFCRKLAADVVSNDQVSARRILRTYAEAAYATDAEAWDLETAAAKEWRNDQVDPAEIEARRALVTSRGRSQVS
ncbi:MAG TPA: enoyl-CoA hydratase [Acidimicrobiales bacterium]|nr:enoyl-CoA hydratase [Acidimicrobiales bacterium]